MMRPRRRKQKGGGQGLVLAVLAIAFLYLTLTGRAQGVDAPAAAPEAGGPLSIPLIWWLAPLGSVVALLFAWVFFAAMKSANPGEPLMVKIAEHVRKGAMAYLGQQYKVVAIVFVVLCLLLAFMAFVLHVQSTWVPFAFLTGGFFSGLAGFLGMRSATMASSRTAFGAKESLNRGLQIAFRSGAVMGLVVVGLGLLDICLWFLLLYSWVGMELREVTVTMLCFGMGASTQALFARVGGGIYTKAADVGADLVGKVEAGIPEDDPRNPATIADNVGDNVGDVAGMGADLYESYCGSVLATAAIGYAVAENFGLGASQQLMLVLLPMIIGGIGNIFSVIGMYAVRTEEKATLKVLMAALFKGINLSTALIVAGSAGACWYFIGRPEAGIDSTQLSWYGVWGAIVVGLIAGWIIGKATEYYTSNEYKPTQGIAGQAQTGPATVIIDGLGVGMVSTWVPVVVVSLGMILAFAFTGGFQNPIVGLYGIAIGAVGMLSTLGITLATDAYGPIADNAGGNAEMSHQPAFVRQRTDALDSLGNTTAATGKGFAIGSAALTALALLAAYVEEVRIGIWRMAEAEIDKASAQMVTVYEEKSKQEMQVQDLGHGFYGVRDPQREGDAAVRSYIQIGTTEGRSGKEIPHVVVGRYATLDHFMTFYRVNLMNPNVLIGAFLGAMMVFVFCALTMKAVGRAAGRMVEEVRRQFREKPGIMEGKEEPDYASCVAISTRGAQREMIFPSCLAITVPIFVGLLLNVAGVMGLLVGGLSCGFVVAVMMANAGGAWDNAKKWIETGQFGGKGSSCHKAAVVGDTVGDPFKDTSGPSLNILIKLMSMVSVVFAGLVVKYSPMVQNLLGLN